MKNVSLRGITKSFGQMNVLDRVDLDIEDGEFLVLVGPSGCGKSTLLRMVAGLEPISGGDLIIGGQRANDLPPQKRNIANGVSVLCAFSAYDGTRKHRLWSAYRGEDGSTTAAKVDKAASILNLHSYLDRYPRQLSGGQRQRVAMGRAIVREPSVFLFR